MPGSQCSTVSVSESLPSPTSCSATVATNDFVLLPARKRSVGRSGRPLRLSATPAAWSRTPWPSLTSAIAPGSRPTTPRSALLEPGGAARRAQRAWPRAGSGASEIAARGGEGRRGRDQRGGEEDGSGVEAHDLIQHPRDRRPRQDAPWGTVSGWSKTRGACSRTRVGAVVRGRLARRGPRAPPPPAC